jgi:hypothetical protein
MALNELCTFLSGKESDYGTNLQQKRGSGFSEMQRLRSAANSAAGKMGDKAKKAAGGAYKGKNKRKNQNSVPGICDGCGAEGLTNKNEAGTLWTAHKKTYFIDGKWKTYSCLGIGKKIHYYLPLSNK